MTLGIFPNTKHTTSLSHLSEARVMKVWIQDVYLVYMSVRDTNYDVDSRMLGSSDTLVIHDTSSPQLT